MNITLFGATGAVGRITLDTLLEAGHTVTAVARSADKLNLTHDRLIPFKADATDADAVARAVRGQDAVIVTLGGGRNLTAPIRSRGTLTIVQAMQAEGVARLICQSTLGAHESWPNLNFWWKRVMFGALLRAVFNDHQVQEDIVRASGLDWTIVRPSAFADGPATGTFREGFGPQERGLHLTIPKADIAGFLTRQISDTAYRHRAVAISN